KIMKQLFKVILFFAASTYGLDVETLPELRTRQYDSDSIEKIVIFSAPRNGSSLVFNVFKYFFEQKDCLRIPHNQYHSSRKVWKTHNVHYFDVCAKKTTLFIVPLRSPLEAAISHARVGALADFPDQMRAKELIHKQFKRLSDAKNKQLKGFQVVFLPY